MRLPFLALLALAGLAAVSASESASASIVPACGKIECPK
jgi:hypothetical protein